MKSVTQIRFFCTKHKQVLKNCGSGRVICPTDSSEYLPDKDGWLDLDSSELYCPQDEEDGEPCNGKWITQAR